MLLSQVNQFFRQLPAGRRALGLVWGAAGGWTVAWALLLVGQGLIPAGQALLLRTLVNRLLASPHWPAILAYELPRRPATWPGSRSWRRKPKRF